MLKIFTYSNKGGKQKNEDYLEYHYSDNCGIFILADGLGGHGNGEIASKLVVQTIMTNLKEKNDIDIDCLKDAFLKANQTLLENQEIQNHKYMKTTVVALSICEANAIWGHIGDSRLYYFSENDLYKVTSDHSVTYKKYLSGEITYKDMHSDVDRSSLLGVFGNQNKYNPEFIETQQAIKKGDAFLLCSDGFWEYVFNEEILIDFLKAENPKQWVENMLIRHIKRTKASNDNYSLIAIFVV